MPIVNENSLSAGIVAGLGAEFKHLTPSAKLGESPKKRIKKHYHNNRWGKVAVNNVPNAFMSRNNTVQKGSAYIAPPKHVNELISGMPVSDAKKMVSSLAKDREFNIELRNEIRKENPSLSSAKIEEIAKKMIANATK